MWMQFWMQFCNTEPLRHPATNVEGVWKERKIVHCGLPMRTWILLCYAVLPGMNAALAPCIGVACGRATPPMRFCAARMTFDSDFDNLDNIIVPDRLPTFGLSERESMRLSYMVKSTEPIFPETFGLQVLFGMLGSQLHGFVGFIIGVGQLGPLSSMLPGRCGHLFRGAGWWAFTAVVRACLLVDRSTKAARVQWLRLAEARVAWHLNMARGRDRAKDSLRRRPRLLAGLRRRLSPHRADRWPSLGGAPTPHFRRGPWHPPPPRELWTPPPGWLPPCKPLWPAVRRGWAPPPRGGVSTDVQKEGAEGAEEAPPPPPLIVTVAADEVLWPSSYATETANEELLKRLESAGVETTVEALVARMRVLQAAGASATTDITARSASATTVTKPLRSTKSGAALRVRAIQQVFELQLLRDGLKPSKLHLVGGDEPDEEAGIFETLWRQAWRQAAEERIDAAGLRTLEGLCAGTTTTGDEDDRDDSAAPRSLGINHLGGTLRLGVLTTAPLGCEPSQLGRLGVDAVVSAEGVLAAADPLHMRPTSLSSCQLSPRPERRQEWACLFDAALRATDAVAAQPDMALRWVHVGADRHGELAYAASLGARTVWVRPPGHRHEPTGDDITAVDAQLSDLADLPRALREIISL